MSAGSVTPRLRLTLLGMGAMNSPRFPPAGLLVRYRRRQIMLDGGPGAEPTGKLAAWLVSDERSELRRELGELAATRGLLPAVATVRVADLVIEPHPVTHTSHTTWGYLLRVPAASAAWAPEFWAFPAWAAGVDLMFADAAACPAGEADRAVPAGRIGRPSLRAIDAGYRLPFGEWGQPGHTYRLPPRSR